MTFQKIINRHTFRAKNLALVLMLWAAASTNILVAQEAGDSTATEAIEVTEEVEAPETPTARVSLVCTQTHDDSILLEAMVKARIDGTLQTLRGINVLFYRVGADTSILLGKAATNNRGVATLKTPSAAATPDEEGLVAYAAKSEPMTSLEKGEDKIGFKKAKLTMKPMSGDSANEVTMLLVAGDKDATPLAEVDVVLYVKRLFSYLKVGEGTTDERGEAVIAFPADLPGDAAGNLTIVARVEEHKEYGNLSATMQQSWGIPVSDVPGKTERALWSTAPPLWMLTTFIVLMTTVWGHFIVIIYELFRLKHETE